MNTNPRNRHCCMSLLISKYERLLVSDADSAKEDAAHTIVGTGIEGIVALERIYNDALELLGGMRDKGYIDAEYGEAFMKRVAQDYPIAYRRSQLCKCRLELACRAIVFEHQEALATLEYAICAIDAVKIAKLEQYRNAKTEGELASIPAPSWPNPASIQKMYRHTASIP